MKGGGVMKADTKTEAAVMAVMQKLFEAFEKKDLNMGLALFAPDPDVVFIGTGGDEKCIGLAEIKAEFERAFAQSKQTSIQLGWHSVSSAGQVAWVAADAVIRAKVSGQEISFPVRFTTVMEQRGDKWLVVQSHDSLPAAGQKEGESWPTG
jgi:uncharacterized protein (TIGR02246 family)